MIIASFDLAGISEVSHCFPFHSDTFIPTDPERALLKQGDDKEAEFENIFFGRILNVNEICQRNGKQLLIREHTHSYFFLEPQDSRHPKSPSWLADQFLTRLGIKVKIIVTVRDPIDSWLGLIANFPEMAPVSFEKYCSKYKTFLNTFISNSSKEEVLFLKYEEIIENPLSELQRVATFIGEPLNEIANDKWMRISSTGNSGRRFDKLQKPPRRPFGNKLIISAKKSDSYLYITDCLKYPHLSKSITTRVRLKAFLVDIERMLATSILGFSERIRNWALRHTRVQ